MTCNHDIIFLLYQIKSDGMRRQKETQISDSYFAFLNIVMWTGIAFHKTSFTSLKEEYKWYLCFVNSREEISPYEQNKHNDKETVVSFTTNILIILLLLFVPFLLFMFFFLCVQDPTKRSEWILRAVFITWRTSHALSHWQGQDWQALYPGWQEVWHPVAG